MRRFASVLSATAALSLAVVGCGGARDRIGALPAPAPTRFDPAELVDVLPPDRIPAIERPVFETTAKAGEWLTPSEPVVVLTLGTESRAYPLAILVWHEVVDDSVGGRSVAVTYSPLTNAAVVFDRSVAGRSETFGVSGKLYRSNLVLYDRHTTSLWTQLDGRSVAGPAKGRALARLPVQIASLEEFGRAYPSGSVLARPEPAARSYGFNPYAGYDSRTTPFGGFVALRPDPRLAPMERVVGVGGPDGGTVVPYSRLRATGVAVPDLGATPGGLGGNLGGPVVVFWRPGLRSPLDAVRLREGRDVGQSGAFVARFPNDARGRPMEFTAVADGFRDRQSGSTWSVLGVATAGPLKGARLAPVLHVDTFWFAWAAFVPSTTIAVG